MERREGSPEREVHSNIGYIKKTEKSQINNLTLHIKELEEQKQTNPKSVSRREEIINIRAELNNIKTKKPKNSGLALRK